MTRYFKLENRKRSKRGKTWLHKITEFIVWVLINKNQFKITISYHDSLKFLSIYFFLGWESLRTGCNWNINDVWFFIPSVQCGAEKTNGSFSWTNRKKWCYCSYFFFSSSVRCPVVKFDRIGCYIALSPTWNWWNWRVGLWWRIIYMLLA